MTYNTGNVKITNPKGDVQINNYECLTTRFKGNIYFIDAFDDLYWINEFIDLIDGSSLCALNWIYNGKVHIKIMGNILVMKNTISIWYITYNE